MCAGRMSAGEVSGHLHLLWGVGIILYKSCDKSMVWWRGMR